MGASRPPPPPRLPEDPRAAIGVMQQWFWDFYNATVTAGYYLRADEQLTPGDLDLSKLPDPSGATVASAQQTANEAYALASQAKAEADRVDFWYRAEIRLEGTANQVTFSFPENRVMPDANYSLVVTPKGFTGTPPALAFIIASQELTAQSFKLIAVSPPGDGNSVTFIAHIRR